MTSLAYREIRYGAESELQTVGVWELPAAERVAAANSDRYWFVYIHGGAWRDPRCLTETAVPAIDRLLAGTSPSSRSAYMGRDRLAGFASIGYRLSPHPQFPQDPATTPPTELRVARHPDHVRDVWAGLAALANDGRSTAEQLTTSPPPPEEQHDLVAPGSPADYIAHDRYIVYGHSCGAFLAFQLWMGAQAVEPADFSVPVTVSPPPPPPTIPRCIVGLEGIYDLRGFVARGGSPAHGGGPGTGFAEALRVIVEGAFGADRAAWDAASPGRFDWGRMGDDDGGSSSSSRSTRVEGETTDDKGKAHIPRPPPRLAVLAYSTEDELVDDGEIDTMEQALKQGLAHRAAFSALSSGGEPSEPYHYFALRDLRGRHDEVHEDGREVARVLSETVWRLDRLGFNTPPDQTTKG
ncbi:hypothetical protein SPI_03295 [Niveomyces insectorum RCEF 264]|uniref:Uncharacterized protein n=1 Tax=Niveomyces insectorum RCEF 264 TaxID=1081102 RepID=A0A167X881_9HYPO|nr:hypothetical protein SPI_03295 [Niveomyces insectorum RCEF 264]